MLEGKDGAEAHQASRPETQEPPKQQTFAAATASGPWASLYSLGLASTAPLLASTSIAVALVPSMATAATRCLASGGSAVSKSNSTRSQAPAQLPGASEP